MFMLEKLCMCCSICRVHEKYGSLHGRYLCMLGPYVCVFVQMRGVEFYVVIKCVYGVIYIGNESRMNLVELGKIGCGRDLWRNCHGDKLCCLMC